MGDPLSIQVTFTNLLSSGLESIDYLCNYYTPHQDQNTHLVQTTSRLQILLSALQNIDDALRTPTWRADEQTILQTIENSIPGCSEVVQELQDEVEKFRRELTRNKVHSLSGTGRRVAYPFRASTLQKLDEDISDLHKNLPKLSTLRPQSCQGTQCEEQTASVVESPTQESAVQVAQCVNFNVSGQAQAHFGDTIIYNDIGEVESLLKGLQMFNIDADLRQWLRAPDSTIDYNNASAKRHTGTGQWLVQGKAFVNWLQRANSFLWLYGFAGCGKTVLCSTAIQHAILHQQSLENSAVAFFFFAFDDELKQDASALLRALLIQLSGQLVGVATELERLKSLCNNGTPPVSALMEHLKQTMTTGRHVYILIDALDESPANKVRLEVLEVIKTLRKWSLPGLHVLVTSRDLPDISRRFRHDDFAWNGEHIALKSESMQRDILDYVTYQIDCDPDFSDWGHHRGRIKEELTLRADGVFRWVACQLPLLRDCPRSKKCLEMHLASLPRDLDESYERMLCAINDVLQEDAKRILALLCLSLRPLSAKELIEALAVDIDGQKIFDADRRFSSANDLLRICPGMIKINLPARSDNNLHSAPSVRIAHFSVQEYLMSTRIKQGHAANFAISRSEEHMRISKTCLLYLKDKKFVTQDLTRDLRDQYLFAAYAARYWPQHYRECGEEFTPQMSSEAVAFMNEHAVLSRWIELWLPNESSHLASPTYYAALLGIDSVLAGILSLSKADISIQQGCYGNALCAAAVACNEKAMWMLLDAGAEVNIKETCYSEALVTASSYGYEGIVRTLVDLGADVNSQSQGQWLEGRWTGGWDALRAASIHGFDKVVQILVDAGAEVNAQNQDNSTALCVASECGHERVVRILIDAKADINAGTARGNPLSEASSNGHERTVRMLLSAGADVNAYRGRCGDALGIASREGYDRIVRLLVNAGVVINTQGGYYQNVLYAASERGYEKVVHVLIEAGADINVQGGQDGTGPYAVAAAYYKGYMRVADLLIDAGATITAEKIGYRKALRAASGIGLGRSVKMLLDQWLDFDAQQDDLDSALWMASAGGHERVVQMLLTKGANAKAREGSYGTALYAASSCGHEQVVQMLLKQGTDFDAQIGGLDSALWMAAGRGHERVVQILLDKGANPNARAISHGTALDAASGSGNRRVVKLLLRYGAKKG